MGLFDFFWNGNLQSNKNGISFSEARTIRQLQLPANVKHKLSEGRTILSFFIGDCSALDTFLTKQNGVLWVIPKYLNALFRGVGQVIFCNNPWSGFLVLFSLYWADITVGLATTLAASTAILTAFIFVQDESKINAGLTTYNAVLVGSVTASLWTPQFGEPITLTLWGFIILGSALSVLVNAGLANLLGSFNPTLPSFTLAFNIVTILLFTCLMPPFGITSDSKSEDQFPIIGLLQDENLHLVGVVQGILLSMGQVYAVNNLVGSIIMYLATLFYSPIVLVMSLVGASVGSFFGIVFTASPYDSVYNGIWGFNAILAAIAVGAFFFIPNGVSFGVAVADVALVVLIQQALTIALTPLRLPFFTFPFVLSSIIFLEVTATRDKLHRVSKFSFPEMHIYEYLQSLAQMNTQQTSSSSSSKTNETHDPSELDNILVQHPSAPPLQLLYPELKDNAGYGYFPEYLQPDRRQPQPPYLRQRTPTSSGFAEQPNTEEGGLQHNSSNFYDHKSQLTHRHNPQYRSNDANYNPSLQYSFPHPYQNMKGLNYNLRQKRQYLDTRDDDHPVKSQNAIESIQYYPTNSIIGPTTIPAYVSPQPTSSYYHVRQNNYIS